MTSAKASAFALGPEHRAWRYWLVDGLPHLVAGLLCLLIASPTLVIYGHPNGKTGFFAGLFFGLLVGYGLFAFLYLREILDWLKSRITYPRTGYAAPPPFSMEDIPQRPALTLLALQGQTEKEAEEVRRERENRKRRLWLLLTVVPFAWIASALIHSPWICAAAGVAAGLGIWLATQNDDRLSLIVAFWLPWIGVVTVQFFMLKPLERTGFFLVGIGIVLTLAGMIALARYLFRNPARGG